MVHAMKDQPSDSTRVRRNHDQSFKDDLIAQSLVSGASVSAIAMKGGINANLLFKWRREHLRTTAQAAPATATLLPVCVIPDADPAQAAQPGQPVGLAASRGARSGVIEVEIAGALLRLRGAVDETLLGSVLRALRRSE
jgi:transposase